MTNIFLKSSFALMLASTLTVPALSYAQEREIKLIEQGTNYSKYDFGDITVIALRDGYVDMATSRLQESPGKALTAVPESVPLHDGNLRLSVNAYLIIDGDSYLLVDTGAADSWLPTMGSLPEALQEAGIEASRINEIAITHTHRDHVNGLMSSNGTVTFPNAKSIYIPEEELDSIGGNLSSLKRLMVPIHNGYKVSSKITAITAAGHSVGHTAYRVDSNKGSLLIWGDTVHVPSVQFARPEVTWSLDGNQDQAREARKKLYDQVVEENIFVAGAHLDFPGVGEVKRTAENGYVFYPTNNQIE